MALELNRRTLEVENLIGREEMQVLVRAEAPVPGAGREAIEALLSCADVYIESSQVESGRALVEGSVTCQAVYRQGSEPSLRALTAKAALSRSVDVDGAESGMFARTQGEVEHVEARYENGRMIFQVTCRLTVWVLRLSQVELIESVSGEEGLQTAYTALHSVRLAAEASEMALLSETVALPAALDARTTLMDWAFVALESAQPDLGGVRVKGRILMETLVSSGVEGRPAVVVRYPVELDQLVEMPEWLTGNVLAGASVRAVRTQVNPSEDGGDASLSCELEVRVSVAANAEDTAQALVDAYATQGSSVQATLEDVALCAGVSAGKSAQQVRGTVLLAENAPGVGTVLAAQAQPVLSQWRSEGEKSAIEGVMEIAVLYMPGGGDLPAAAQAELPFALTVPMPLSEDSDLKLQILSVEASALMSDRLEVKIQLEVLSETRQREAVRVVTALQEGEPLNRRSGIIICWPEEGEDAWQLGKRFHVPAALAGEVTPGAPLILRC